MTQTEVAIALGRPQSFVAKYERGERRLDAVELVEVCVVLGTKPEGVVAAIKARMKRKSLG